MNIEIRTRVVPHRNAFPPPVSGQHIQTTGYSDFAEQNIRTWEETTTRSSWTRSTGTKSQQIVQKRRINIACQGFLIRFINLFFFPKKRLLKSRNMPYVFSENKEARWRGERQYCSTAYKTQHDRPTSNGWRYRNLRINPTEAYCVWLCR